MPGKRALIAATVDAGMLGWKWLVGACAAGLQRPAGLPRQRTRFAASCCWWWCCCASLSASSNSRFVPVKGDCSATDIKRQPSLAKSQCCWALVSSKDRADAMGVRPSLTALHACQAPPPRLFDTLEVQSRNNGHQAGPVRLQVLLLECWCQVRSVVNVVGFYYSDGLAPTTRGHKAGPGVLLSPKGMDSYRCCMLAFFAPDCLGIMNGIFDDV
jgi:hypothetical protein